MKMNPDFKRMLFNAMLTCVKHADCKTLVNVFRAADWTYTDGILNEEYNPTERELRGQLYSLGNDVVERIEKDYEEGKWTADNTYSQECGRLSFDVKWNDPLTGEPDLITDIQMECNIKTSVCIVNMGDMTKDYYNVEAYVDEDNEFTEQYELS